MPAARPIRTRRWQAALIIVVVGALALGAAATGWWYARESPPHQGPIVLVAVDGLAGSEVGAGRFPAIDALAAEGVTFARAYAHTPQTLPGYATLLTGRLPFEHGVRDDGGFVLRPEMRTLAELLRNRGFDTGGAVSTYFLRRDAGMAQGFQFFDDAIDPAQAAGVERTGVQTSARALEWLEAQGGQRFFLFVEVPAADANAAVEQIVSTLKSKDLYETATLLVVGGRASVANDVALDEAALRVGFVVKQPRGMLSGHRVPAAVQLADVVPTILDLVRAPQPGGFYGRSLRPVLDHADGIIPARPIYGESLAGYYRLGATPLFAVITDTRQLLRNGTDTEVALATDAGAAVNGAPVPDSVPLSAVLDELVVGRPLPRPQAIDFEQERRLALGGFLAGPEPLPDVANTVSLTDPAALQTHRRAAQLVGQERFADAVKELQRVAAAHPALGVVHWEIGQLLLRVGRIDEAIVSLDRAERSWPDSLPVALALSDALRRSGKLQPALTYANAAIARAERGTAKDRLAAQDSAARVALALRDGAAATTHASVSAEVDPTSRLPKFVRGRLLFDAGKYEEAVEAFSEGAEAPPADDETPAPAPVAELELYRGESLVRLDRPEDAEDAFRSEISAFPRDPRAYVSLAMLYQQTKPDEVGEVLEDLIVAVPTIEGYRLAAAAWAAAGNEKRADELRADARVRFRGDPSLSKLFPRGGRR